MFRVRGLNAFVVGGCIYRPQRQEFGRRLALRRTGIGARCLRQLETQFPAQIVTWSVTWSPLRPGQPSWGVDQPAVREDKGAVRMLAETPVQT